MKIISIFGTRPEAIKMAPIVKLLSDSKGVESITCVSGQHQQIQQQVLDIFKITPQYYLDTAESSQSLNGLCSQTFTSIDAMLEALKPDRILVHGDTSTAAISAMAAFHRRIPVAHVEAGLRTGNMYQPWPQEMNRRVIDLVSDYLFAPTYSSAENLSSEHLSGKTIITGNTVIDALYYVVDHINNDINLRHYLDQRFSFLQPDYKTILVTDHCRERFGIGFEHICKALLKIADSHRVNIVYPVHLNPEAQYYAQSILGHHPHIHLTEPLDYLHFVRLMQHADLVLTDSGSIQEEAPALNKPVLVMRNVTERPEAVETGSVKLIGMEQHAIFSSVSKELIKSSKRDDSMINSPYGDGHAAERIVAALTQQPFLPFFA